MFPKNVHPNTANEQKKIKTKKDKKSERTTSTINKDTNREKEQKKKEEFIGRQMIERINYGEYVTLSCRSF